MWLVRNVAEIYVWLRATEVAYISLSLLGTAPQLFRWLDIEVIKLAFVTDLNSCRFDSPKGRQKRNGTSNAA